MPSSMPAISPFDVVHRAEDTLASVAVAAVAELDRLERAGRGARRHDRPPDRSGIQQDLDLDGRDCRGSRGPHGR